MIRSLSFISVSIFSMMWCDVVRASSCSAMDSDNYENDSEYHEVFAVCSGDVQADDIFKFTSDDNDDDDAYHGHATGESWHHNRSDESEHSDHEFDWSEYDLAKHEHQSGEYHGYLDHDDASEHDHHHYLDEHKNDHVICLPKYGVGVSVVPVPAAVWLFVSGLFGLVISARRKHK